MKKICIFLLAVFCLHKVSAQSANTTLSNLTTPVAVNVNLLPAANKKFSLGSSARRWKKIYLDSGLFLNGDYGLFFNPTLQQYEFRNGSNLPVFSLNANNGNAAILGTLKVGAYTLPATDGANGQVLTTNGGGVISWAPASNTYTAGNGIAITGNVISSTAGVASAGYPFSTSYGILALYSNTTGIENTANGYEALYANTEGYNNTATGYQALYSNTTGIQNTTNGYQSLYANTTGYNNTANGFEALYLNTEGFYNTANGSEALYSNTEGYNNTANGLSALYSNTEGYNNTANGFVALYFNTTGYNNTANGLGALEYNTTGFENTANGLSALYNNTTGYHNTAIGVQALASSVTGSNCTAIGTYADAASNYYNTTMLGYYVTATASNQVRIGNSQVTSIGGYVGWSNMSDGRYKKNIKENVPGLQFINQLKPVTYTLDITGIDKHLNGLRARIKSPDGKEISQPTADEAAAKAKEQIVYTGFIAQEVETTAKKLGFNFSGVDAPKNDNDFYGLRYAEFVVPLVKAVQELSKMNDDKDTEINELQKTSIAQKKTNEDLQKQINDLKLLMQQGNKTDQSASATNNLQQTINLAGASLGQNTPNPFINTTTISYTLPQRYSSAKITVVDELGTAVKTITLSGFGKGSTAFSVPLKAEASYHYSLFVDGKLIDTKQMVLAK